MGPGDFTTLFKCLIAFFTCLSLGSEQMDLPWVVTSLQEGEPRGVSGQEGSAGEPGQACPVPRQGRMWWCHTGSQGPPGTSGCECSVSPHSQDPRSQPSHLEPGRAVPTAQAQDREGLQATASPSCRLCGCPGLVLV